MLHTTTPGRPARLAGREPATACIREVGKRFPTPSRLAMESAQIRLDRGLSFTEFSYMLIQATILEHLPREMGVELQMGGAALWGTSTAGLALIRRGAGGDPGG